METLRKFINSIKERLKKAIEDGEVDKANEISANLMVGTMASFMALAMLVGWILNEVGVFTANSRLMRETAIIAIVISMVLAFLNRLFHADKYWLKYVLLIGLTFECGAMCCILGHNVTLVTVIPAIFAIRYFNKNFSIQIGIVSAVAFFISTIVCAYIGIENLNVLPLAPGKTLVIVDDLRSAINVAGFDRGEYILSFIKNDYLPKALIYVIITAGCYSIAKRGREMLNIQDATAKKTSRIETELNLATEIQKNMLPCTLPAFPCHTELELLATNIPAKEVGGDFYDYFIVDDDHVAMLIADVSGKGVGAALFMMISKTVIKNQLQLGLDPAEAMTNANRELCENNTAGLFVTVWVGVYEVSTGILRYVNAGHNPPIIKKVGKECYYHKGKTGFVLAGMDDMVYHQSELQLNSGDELFLYTDGVTEATNKDNELFGEDRLLECLNKFSEESVEEQLKDVLGEVNSFVNGAEQFDDITMLGMKVHKK